ncbi:hypothetical protein E3J62_11115 [candidate division TA06 bacterium]|uniref:Uncharacterized protein n=1 Tax=candidate division TA06 bacterium TaxID=2250710 RepID=A0A523UP10_UNCT6|nr:MAG: hypothetical protein E3J62_11115 [candidate division TA06 bacterium]
MESLLADPIFLRGIERMAICLGLVFCAFLGYLLFTKGVPSRKSELELRSPVMRVVLSGRGPGLFFMALAIIGLIYALISGEAYIREQIGNREAIKELHFEGDANE